MFSLRQGVHFEVEFERLLEAKPWPEEHELHIGFKGGVEE